MMNKLSLYTLLLIIVIFTIQALPEDVTARETLPDAIKPLSNIGGYIYLNNEKIGFATFMKGQRYRLESQDEKFYHVSFGNGLLYVDKKQAQKVPFPIASALPKGTSSVLTKNRIYVYAHSKSGSPSLGYVNSNIRIPVIKDVNEYYEINFGGKKGYIVKSQTTKDNGIPVLMYHHMMVDKALSDQANNNMTIEYLQFNNQMNYLKDNNWKTITLEQLDSWLTFNYNLPERAVVITFDDGINSTVNLAYPLLKRMNFHATSFVITGKIRQSEDYWVASDFQYVGLKEITATTDIFDYQHHSHNMHLYKPREHYGMFKTESYDAIKQDIESGYSQLGKAFSNDIHRTKYLAYPFGHYNETTIKAVSDAGIRMAFTTITGNVKLQDAPYELKRQGIAPYHTMDDFIQKLEGTYNQLKMDTTIYQ